MSNVATSVTMRPDLFFGGRFFGIPPAGFAEVNRSSVRWIAGWCVREMAKATSAAGQGQPGGAAWDALTPKYLQWKQEQGMESIMGVATGDMRGSIIPDTEGFDFDDDRLLAKIGPVVPYAGYFDKKRPLTPVRSYLLTHWTEAHCDLLLKKIRGGR